MATSKLEQRIQRLLVLRTDTPAMLESMSAVSSAITAAGTSQAGSQPSHDRSARIAGAASHPYNAWQTEKQDTDTEAIRKQLRSAVEWHSLEVAEGFIAKIQPLDLSFQRLMTLLDTLHDISAAAADRIAASESSTAAFMTQAQVLLAQRDGLDRQLSAVTEFLDQYELSPLQLAVLAAGPVEADGGTAFYEALQRVTSIHSHAVQLITGPKHALGVELLESATRQHSESLDRLFAWAHTKCKDYEMLTVVSTSDLSDASTADIALQSPNSARSQRNQLAHMMQLALRILRAARPAHFRSCQETAATAAKNHLVRKFLRALTGTGGITGRPSEAEHARPIDASAHDPLRYVGDMCAWVHYNVAEQQEVLKTIFFNDLNVQSFVPELPPDAVSDSAALPLGAMLGASTDSITRPLCLRVDQVVNSQQSLVTCFKLYDTLTFYAQTLGGMLPTEASCLQGLVVSQQNSGERFHDQVSLHAEKNRVTTQTFPADLSASSLVLACAAELDQLCRSFESSLSAPDTSDRPALEPAIESLLNPLIENCRASAEGLRLADTATYMLNNLAALHSALAATGTSGRWNQRLHSEMKTWQEALVEQTANDLLNSCGLLGKLASMRTARDAGSTLASVDGLRADDLRPIFAAFYNLLTSQTLATLHDKVSSPRVRADVRRSTMEVLVAAYKRFVGEVSDPAGGYGMTLLPNIKHSPTEIELLLDIR
jgi:hypothetical protein